MNELLGMGQPSMGPPQGMGMPDSAEMGMPPMGAMQGTPPPPGNELDLDDETMMLLQQLAVQDPGAYQQMMAELGLPPEMFMQNGGAGQPAGMGSPLDQRSDMSWQSLVSSPTESNVSPIVDKVARQLGLYDNTSGMSAVGADPYNQGAQLDDSIMQLLGGGAY